ncbi:MAG: type I-E CRISPR-associated protein Cse2/CasB [Clostridia bacterium]
METNSGFHIDLLTNGDRAALKRCVGKTLNDADGTALTAFYKARPCGMPVWQENRAFAALCMDSLWRAEQRPIALPMEECLKRLEGSDSFQRRVCALLDTRWSDEDGYLLVKIARLVRMIRHADMPMMPQIEQLFADLLYWNAENRTVQKRWARTLYNQIKEDSSHAV